MAYRSLFYRSLFYLLLFVLSPIISSGAISFTDGKWETTFDCAEWGRQDGDLTCDDMNEGLSCEDYSYLFGCSVGGCGTDCLSLEEEITTSANYPLGGGGRGMLHKLCGCPEATLSTSSSGGVQILFPATKELWIRSYMKWGANRTWVDAHDADMKLFYLYDDTGSAQTILSWHNGVLSSGVQGVVSANHDTTLTWEDVHGNGTKTGDDEWHYIETHIKMDTDGTDGVYEVWVDNSQRQNKTNIDYGNATAGSAGWVEMRFLSNSHYVYGPTTVALDDLVIYNTTPPNIDVDGNPYIGPIETSANPIVEISTASGQTTTASVFEITGTATADTGLTISSVTCPGQTVTADDGIFDELIEAWTCQAALAVGVNNLVFTGTDSVANTGTDSITINRTEIPTSHSLGKGFSSTGCPIH